MLTALLALALLGAAACEDTAPLRRQGADAAGRPFPELTALQEVVAETRSILPHVPTTVPTPPLAAAEDVSAPATREVLRGTARLLRPSAFPRLPQRLAVALHLDDRDPPGGHLAVQPQQAGPQAWPILTTHRQGARDGDFAHTFRLTAPGGRLRYLVLLGLRHGPEGAGFRAFEGYLVHPHPQGGVSVQGAVYAVDFGYRHPEPPTPVRLAAALAPELDALAAALAEWHTRTESTTGLAVEKERLRRAKVPAEQVAQQQQDLAAYERKLAAARQEAEQAATVLRKRLQAAYEARVALAEAWLAFTESNAWRWRNAAERRAAYRPLQALRAALPALEDAYTALGGDGIPALRTARAALEPALLREQEHAPLP